MDNSLLINKYILSFLENSEAVTEILGSDEHKIFPLIQPDSLTFPYIVFQRSSVYPQYTKDLYIGSGFGWTNTVNVIIKCVSNDYIESVELANPVKTVLPTESIESVAQSVNEIIDSRPAVENIEEIAEEDQTLPQVNVNLSEAVAQTQFDAAEIKLFDMRSVYAAIAVLVVALSALGGIFITRAKKMKK